jgi:enterobactin synthetase component D
MTSTSRTSPSSASWPLVVPLPSGCIVLVPVPDARGAPDDVERLVQGLPELERTICAPWALRRQATFAAGRIALREACRRMGFSDLGPIARDDRGAPVLPTTAGSALPGAVRASITHKDSLAGALVVTDADDLVTWGVDLELENDRDAPSTDSLARQVLQDHELHTLPVDDVARRRAVLARFSWKESLYKALDPFLRRFIGFQEVDVTPSAPHLDDVVFGGGFFERDGVAAAVGARYRLTELPDVILTTATVRRRKP